MSKPKRPDPTSPETWVTRMWERYADEMDTWLTDTVLPVLEEAKRRFAPTTTNSDADDLIKELRDE